MLRFHFRKSNIEIQSGTFFCKLHLYGAIQELRKYRFKWCTDCENEIEWEKKIISSRIWYCQNYSPFSHTRPSFYMLLRKRCIIKCDFYFYCMENAGSSVWIVLLKTENAISLFSSTIKSTFTVGCVVFYFTLLSYVGASFPFINIKLLCPPLLLLGKFPSFYFRQTFSTLDPESGLCQHLAIRFVWSALEEFIVWL